MRIIKRLRVAWLEWKLAKLLYEHRRVMNMPGATAKWTLDAMEKNAAPIRVLQLEIAQLWKELS